MKFISWNVNGIRSDVYKRQKKERGLAMSQFIRINSQLDALRMKEFEKKFYEKLSDNVKIVPKVTPLSLIHIYNDDEDEEDNKQKQVVQNIKELGTTQVPTKENKEIQCITIIGEIEGHFMGNPQKKATKYEHIIPMLYSIEEDPEIKGILAVSYTHLDVYKRQSYDRFISSFINIRNTI